MVNTCIDGFLCYFFSLFGLVVDFILHSHRKYSCKDIVIAHAAVGQNRTTLDG